MQSTWAVPGAGQVSWPTLNITGDFKLGAKAVWMAMVDWLNDTNICSKVAVTGKPTIVAGAEILPNAPAPGDAKTIIQWDILTSDGGFTDATLPTVPAKWTASEANNKLTVKYTV